MKTTREKHPLKKKLAVAFEMIKQQQTVAQICSRFSIHSSQAHAWKKKALAAMESSFDGNPALESRLSEKEAEIDELYRQIGQAKVENDYLKKNTRLIP